MKKCALTAVFNLDSAYKNLLLTETMSWERAGTFDLGAIQ